MQEQDHKTSVVDTDIVNNDQPVVDPVNTDILALETVDNHTFADESGEAVVVNEPSLHSNNPSKNMRPKRLWRLLLKMISQ